MLRHAAIEREPSAVQRRQTDIHRRQDRTEISKQNLLDHDIPSRPCSRIWALCKKAIPFISKNLSKVPQGGRNTNIWNDRIMGQAPLKERQGTHRILSHLHNFDLNWDFQLVPSHLEEDLINLKVMLHGATPLLKGSEDNLCWDPSESAYTIKAAYS